jgi:hypothetical protein
MRERWSETRAAWFISGIAIGLAVALYWPHEPAMAEVVDRSEKFAMCTVQTQPGSSDAVFVLDFLTGRLVGGAYQSQTRSFQAYARNIAGDFQIDAGTPAQYSIAPAFIEVRAGGTAGGGTPANGALYVGEMNSGRVILYGFMYRAAGRPGPPIELTPIGQFPFRESL